MLIVPVISFAEQATDTTVTVSVNSEAITALAGNDAALYAAIIEQASLVLHAQNNQFRAMLGLGEYTVADLVLELAEQGIIIGSNLIDNNAILLSYEDLQALMPATTPSEEDSASAGFNINFDHTMEVIQENMKVDMKTFDSWDLDSDPATTALIFSITPENFLKIFDATFEDIQKSGAADQILSLAGQGGDFDAAAASSKEELSKVLPESGDFLTVTVGLNDNSDPVCFMADIYYRENVIVDVTFNDTTNDAGEVTSTDIQYIYANKNKELAADLYRTTTDTAQMWNGTLVEYVEGEDISSYYGLNLDISENAFYAQLDFGTYTAGAEEPEIVMIASLNIADTSSDAISGGSFDFTVSMIEEDDFAPLFSINGTAETEGINSKCKVALYLGGFEEEIGSLSISTAAGTVLDSIANKNLINFKDLNEETLQDLGNLIVNHLSGLLGAPAGASE